MILSADGSPVEQGADRLEDHEVEILGASRRVAFVLSNPGPATDDEWHGIERLGDRYCIVGRIRLDARGTLRARLAASTGSPPAEPSDALLCLHAYAKWGECFVDFLVGDFCFALWDDTQGSLICARDQLGVRSLFHAEAGNRRFVSDSLDWIASKAAPDRTVDEWWIADFLCVGRSLDFDRTVYRQVRRLPPAHIMKMSGADMTVRRYWRLNIREPLYYRDRRLYAERFRELLAAAVADRLPAGKVGISMSGGLDSTTLAAFAVDATADASRVVAECVHYERLMPDAEAHFSSLAARHLDITLRLRAVDDLNYDPQWRARSTRTAEPSSSVISAHYDRLIVREMAAAAPVWFYGEGPDNALRFEQGAYLSWLAGRREWRRLAVAVSQYAKAKGVRSWMETARRHLGRRESAGPDPLALPPWLDRDLARRLRLEERIRDANDIFDPSHAWHPRAVGSFGNPIWQGLFDDRDQEETMASLVWRHPYLDLRVVEFMLSVPPVPWAREKLLMRVAMRDRLPREILLRKKTPLAGSPLVGPIRAHGLGDLPAGDRLNGFVHVDKLATDVPSSHHDLVRIVDVHALDYWMGQGAPASQGFRQLPSTVGGS